MCYTSDHTIQTVHTHAHIHTRPVGFLLVARFSVTARDFIFVTRTVQTSP